LNWCEGRDDAPDHKDRTMTTTDKTKAGYGRGRRAVAQAAAVEQVQEVIVTTPGMETIASETRSGITPTFDTHGVAEDAQTGGEAVVGGDIVAADAGNGTIAARNGALAGDGACGTGAPRGTRRQGRCAKQLRPGTKASASSWPVKAQAGKNARIVELVSRPEGAGIDELTAATGWQRHTIRAALTRLRQSGFTVELRTGEDGHRAYHHAAITEVAS
jgi:hypothetical protein